MSNYRNQTQNEIRMTSENNIVNDNVNDHTEFNQEECIQQSKNIQPYATFDDMELCDKLLRGIYAYGFEKPSAIQQRAIVPFTQGNQLIAQAQSGTGKTGTFTIGLLERIFNKIDTKDNPDLMNKCRAIVLAPTRELADQIHKVISDIGNHLKVKCVKCVGGESVRNNIDHLRRGCDVVVGTPGRIYDMLKRNEIDGSCIQCFILDEADEMLNAKGFQDSVYDILMELPQKVQIGLFSATMPREVLELTTKFMNNAIKIIVKAEELTLEGIRQFYIAMDSDDWKFDTLCDLYKYISISSSVIFCNTRKRVNWLTDSLEKEGFAVSATHGGLKPTERTDIIKQFRNGETRVLITTDLLARGIDVQHVSIVINYDLPMNIENYLHRIGRSGRFGRKGLAINFVTKRGIPVLREIEKFYDTHIDELPKDIENLV